MPAMASRGGGRRRTINEINMVPFIDVMLVLLIIFMVTAPMLTPGMIDVPSVGKAAKQPPAVAQIVIDKDGQVQFKHREESRSMSVREIGQAARQWQTQQAEGSAVVITADKGIAYDKVVQAMDALQKAGVQRVGLSVKQGG